MVKINNQRKAFLDMLAWSERAVTDVRKPECGYDVIVGGELFTDYSDHPRKLVTLNPKLKSTGAGRYQLLSRWWDAASSLAWKTSLRKVRTLWAGIAADWAWRFGGWSWWYPSGNRPLQQYLGFTAGRWLWSVPGIKADSLIAKFKEAGGTVRDWCMSRVTAIISPLLIITVIVCLSWAVNHYRDNAITYKAQRDKNARELKLWQTRQLLTCRCVSVMLLRSFKIHEGIGWC